MFFTFFGIKLRPAYLGLAFAFSYTYATLRIISDDRLGYFQFTEYMAIGAATLVFFVLARHLGRNISCATPCQAVFPLVAAIGALGLTFADGHRDPYGVILFLGAMCGTSIAWLYLLWGSFYSSLTIKQAILVCYLSSALSALIKMTLSFMSLVQYGSAFCAFLPMVSLICWRYACRDFTAEAPGKIDYAKHSFGFFWRMGFVAFIFSFVIGAVQSFSQNQLYSLPYFFQLSAHVIILLVSFGTILLVAKKSESFEHANMWLFILIAVASCLIIAHYTEGTIGHASLSIMLATQQFALVFIYIALADIARKSSFCSDMVYGVGWSLWAVPVALGTVFVRLPFLASDQMNASLAIIYILILTLFFDVLGQKSGSLSFFGSVKAQVPSTQMGQLSERMDFLASRYRITEREKEILMLYAQGRNRFYISSSLFISENTVRDHIKNAYKKMGIHNKQHFLDLLQGPSGTP
ncbi:MAG: LuxR family transcriptional regulator [Coriobacteriaceae bacterium]|nr:LuxR family transcriptional regulator [Coriobacteriaceae bacterium]